MKSAPIAVRVEGVGRRERGAVEQDVPAQLVRLGDPLERVLHAAEVGLRRKREELCRRALPSAAPRRAGPCGPAPVEAQVLLADRHVGDRGAPLAGELADAVDGVVVVVGEQEATAGRERVRLADELERAARVGREDDLELVLGGVEEAAHRVARLLGELGRGERGRGSASAGCRARARAAVRDGDGSATPRRGRRRCSRGTSARGGRAAHSRRRAARRSPRSPRTPGTAAGSRRERPPCPLPRSAPVPPSCLLAARPQAARRRAEPTRS